MVKIGVELFRFGNVKNGNAKVKWSEELLS